jgi:hypothetical protein
VNVRFDGGPLDGIEIDGLMARVLVDAEPPFACFNVDGRYEHYVAEDANRFTHVGACHLIALAGMHPACGHNHSEDW